MTDAAPPRCVLLRSTSRGVSKSPGGCLGALFFSPWGAHGCSGTVRQSAERATAIRSSRERGAKGPAERRMWCGLMP